MAGHFELLSDRQSHIRFRLVAPDGTFLALSGPFDDKKSAVLAISAVRECAGTGLIEDHCIVGTQNTLHDPEPEVLDGFDLKSEHVGEVLAELAGLAEATLSPARPGASFGITIIRAKKPPASAGRGALALRLNELQDSLGEGPGMTAMAEKRTVLVRDLADDGRWPLLAQSPAGRRIRSVLGIPLPADGQANAVLTLSMGRPDGFTEEAIHDAETFAEQASKIIRPALRIAEFKDVAENLQAALAHRTVIDTALGVVMAQNHCGHNAASAILRRAASTRNVRLRDAAASVVASVARQPDPWRVEPLTSRQPR